MSFYVSLLYLQLGNDDAVKFLLDRMESMVTKFQSIDMAIFMMIKCLYALGQGDRESAYRYGRTSLQAHASVGATITALEVSCIIAIERCETGKPEEALDYLALPRSQGLMNSPRMRYQVFLIEGYACLQQGDRSRCHELLREAFTIGRSHHYFGNVFWLLRILPRLCAEALRASIEVDYIQQLIRKCKLLAEDSSIGTWPWPVRIYTLGQFKVEVDDQAIPASKAQRKPFTLLEVLIALGGAEVKVEWIAELLWPDAEGDAAISSFTTTVSRLRKLIGEETIIVKGGRVSLDERRCWVDVRVLERQLNEADRIGADSASVREYAEKLLDLYRGPFLSNEEEAWAQGLRDRLRDKFARTLARCVIAVRAAGEREAAARLLEKAMVADPEAMNKYRELMPI